MIDDSEARRRAHEAISGLLDDGEIAVAWTLQIDAAGPDGTRYLAHRSGGGHDGTDRPMVWVALGMLLQAAVRIAETQLDGCTTDTRPGADDEPDED